MTLEAELIESIHPSVTSLLRRSVLTGAVRNQKASMEDGSIDLLVTIHLSGEGLLEFERSRDVVDAGYDASVRTVREWAAARAESGAN